MGGTGGAFSGQDFACGTKFPVEGVSTPDPADLLPSVEEVPAAKGLVIDVETFSVADLKKVGLHFYASHPTTGVSVACYAIGPTGEVRTWYPGQPVPEEIQRHIAAGGKLTAHNSGFEAEIIQHILGPRYGWLIPKPEQWSCTLARAAYHAFPPSLDELSEAVPLTNKKGMEGHALMLRMSRPRGFRPEGTPRWWHEEDPARLARLAQYCRGDILAEQELDRRVPELPERERRLWLMDVEINDHGILIDTRGAQALADAVEVEVAALGTELARLTDGAVSAVTNPGALRTWLAERGLNFTSLDKEHLGEALASPAVKPMLGTLGADDRARGLFAYYGALRTGRWAGRRIQPQNLVRGHADAAAVIDAMVAGAKLEELAQQHRTGRLELIAGCLRGLFVAPPGKRLVVVDLSQIEARVLAWLARQEDLLDVFRDPTRDTYVFTAARLGSDDRQLGKVATLGLGFQMGAERFVNAAKGYGVVLTDNEAAHHVAQWRSDHPAIVRLWWDMADTVATIAGGSVGDKAEVGRCLVYRRPGSVRIRLPSGRELIYHQMQLVERSGSPRGELVFMGAHPLSRKWTQQRTYGGKLVENIVQAVARDVLADVMLTLHERGHKLLGSVHDEVLLEADEVNADALLEETLMLMRTPPSWADGLPVEADGFVSPRYRKA
jgi:DNA polymerase